MPRFYRYVIYRLYTWRIGKKDDTPVATIVFIMTAVHCFQLFIIYGIVLKIFPNLKFFNINKITGIIVFFILCWFYYLIVYSKKRWEGYIQEFKDESPEDERKGTKRVIAFTWGSIVLFFMLIPLIFIGNKLHYH